MTVTEALEKLKTYEQTSFALGHAMGLLYYDGVTVAPKGAAAVRGDTSAELSRIDYQLTTAPETVEMLETLMAAREELDAGTRRKGGGGRAPLCPSPPHPGGGVRGLPASVDQG